MMKKIMKTLLFKDCPNIALPKFGTKMYLNPSKVFQKPPSTLLTRTFSFKNIVISNVQLPTAIAVNHASLGN